MKILTVGGGSGGHIIPVKAVVNELLKADSTLEIDFWCDRKSLRIARPLFSDGRVRVRTIVAGKFRRYYHLRWWQHLSPSILLPNVVDLFKFGIGFIQSLIRLLALRPDLVFAKGGFVCLPVGLAARLLRIKIITHDSDTVAGLTNRLLAKYAVKITTGMPVEYYNYPSQKTIFVGIPTLVKDKITSVKPQKLNLPKNKKVILVSGGGLGSEFLNDLIIDGLKTLNQDLFVVLIAGKLGFERLAGQGLPKDKILLLDFVSNFDQYLVAADLVVARAGATTLAELANAAKPVILVPNPKLVGGHQLKNAQILADQQAAVVLDEFELEKQPHQLIETINKLAIDAAHQEELRLNIAKIARPQAAFDLAKIILAEGRARKRRG